MNQYTNFGLYISNLKRDLENCNKAIARKEDNSFLLTIKSNLEKKLSNIEETEKEYNNLFI